MKAELSAPTIVQLECPTFILTLLEDSLTCTGGETSETGSFVKWIQFILTPLLTVWSQGS